MTAASIDPVLKTIVVPLASERAFELFFSGMATWWPLASHSVYGVEASVTVEGRRGGRIVERAPDGREAVWGELLEWEPPARAVVAWHPGREAGAATVFEVRFADVDGTGADGATADAAAANTAAAEDAAADTSRAAAGPSDAGAGRDARPGRSPVTRVDLEHRGWEVLGAAAVERRADYETGWNDVLGVCYGRAALRG